MKTVNPPTLMFICLVVMIALHLILPLGLFSSWFLLALGVAVIGFGMVVAFAAEGQFRRRGTTVDHLGKASGLVTDGWFQYSRNPMYLSFLIMLIGAWLSLGSISPLLGIILYFLLTEQWYIRPEEKRLTDSFGKEYAVYQRRTRRWL